MATTANERHELAERCEDFLSQYYRDEIGTLAQHFPQERTSLVVDHNELFGHDPALADDCLSHPAGVIMALEDALARVDIPAPVDLKRAHVRLAGLPDERTYYPGEFSPSEHEGSLRAIEGEITKATDAYARLEVAVFECQRCGIETEIPQAEDDFQEPHECTGCERQGPFEVDYDASEFVDGQKIRIQTPPEEAQGDGQDIDVFVEDDLVDVATVGDRVTITGIVRLEQQSKGKQKTNKFDPYVDGQHIAVEETDARDVDISAEQRQRIEALAAGEEGDPLELAAESLAPKIYGYDYVKRALVLALVGGDGAGEGRGEFHVLLIGDPSTGKSKLVERVEDVGWRSVGVSGSGATKAGVTATAIQGDFGDGSWTLDAGAAVKAHRGVLAIDELDDMPQEVRSALLEPMSKQTIHITKGGINTHLQTKTAVVAASNPKDDRFDPYAPIPQQFEFTSTLLSRFDLVFTFTDRPDADEDASIAEHILASRDADKRLEQGKDFGDVATDPRPPIDDDTLRAWIALAKQQPAPTYADAQVKEQIKGFYTEFRGVYGYDDPDDPVPVTARSLEGIVRVAEAAAKLEFSETIEERHVQIATNLVGKSMRDIGRDEDGNLDADVKETGRSKALKDRKEIVVETIQDLQSESEDDMASVEDVIDALAEDFDESRIERDIQQLRMEDGEATEPRTGYVRYIGRY